MASILHLFISGSPSTISRFVVSIIFNPVNRMFRCRSLSHVRQERAERPSPSVTNRDAPPTVVLPVPMIRVLAPLFHVLPDHIESLVVVRLSSFGLGNDLPFVTPTTGSDSLLNQVRVPLHKRSAFTQEYPNYTSIGGPGFSRLDCRKSSKRLPRDVIGDNFGCAIPKVREASGALFWIIESPPAPPIATHSAVEVWS